MNVDKLINTIAVHGPLIVVNGVVRRKEQLGDFFRIPRPVINRALTDGSCVITDNHLRLTDRGIAKLSPQGQVNVYQPSGGIRK